MAKQFDQGDWGRHWTEQDGDAPPPAPPVVEHAAPEKKRRGWIFAVLALLVAGGIGGAIALTSGDEEPAPPPALALSDENDPAPEPARPDYLGGDDTTAPATGDGVLTPLGGPDATPAPVPVPVEGQPPTPEPASPAVPDSYGIYRGGQIFLEGAVPTQDDSDRIEALAAEVLGEDNVINNYEINPAAADPSKGQIIVEDKVLFASGSAIIQPEFEPLLQQGVLLMAIRPAVTLTIVGHTDSEGSDELNDALSQARSEAAVAYMVARGADASRLTAVGRGEREPIATNATAAGRLQNRRLEIFIENLLS